VERVIAKGAEADLVLREWNGLETLHKIRRPKAYRNPELDSRLRRSRTKAEADIIHRAKLSGVPTPLLYHVDPDDAVIVMEYVDGVKVRDAVDTLSGEERRELFIRIGGYAGRLHGAGIIHGDLTTSNILKQGDRLVFIDFGLAEVSTEVEKRGVDLNLMNRMLTSTHYRYQEELLAAFVEGYRETLGVDAEEALMRMEEVAKRGRYIEKN
jgi:Kae1-associated kinase Bud32